MTQSVTLLQECDLTASRFSVYLQNKFKISHAWIVELLLGYAENCVCVCVCVRERERERERERKRELITVTTEALMLSFIRAIHHKIEINTSS